MDLGDEDGEDGEDGEGLFAPLPGIFRPLLNFIN